MEYVAARSIEENLSASFSELFHTAGGPAGVEGSDVPDPYAERDVPVIDVSALHFDSEEGWSEERLLLREETCRRIVRASETWGFFQVVNHGIDLELLKRMVQVTMDFHKLSGEEKMKSYLPGVPGGYSSRVMKVPGSRLSDSVDFLFHNLTPPWSRFPDAGFPLNPPEYRSTQAEYSKEALKLSQRLLAALSLGLGLRKDVILEKIGGETGEPRQSMRSDLYRPSGDPGNLGLGAHTDPGGITVLLQDDLGGLEVQPSQKWVKIQPIPGALVINIGDQIEILSNGKYKSCLHRGMPNPAAPRVSIATFYGPGYSMTIGPLDELIDGTNQARYKTQTYDEYFKEFRRRGHDGKNHVQPLRLTT